MYHMANLQILSVLNWFVQCINPVLLNPHALLLHVLMKYEYDCEYQYAQHIFVFHVDSYFVS